MASERFDIDVGYNDPDDRRDDFPEDKPSPDEYMDSPSWCVSCFRAWKEDGRDCPRCGWPHHRRRH